MKHHQRRQRRGCFSKAKAQVLHARGRALRRYGIDLTPALLATWIADIQAKRPRARFLLRQSHRVTLWAVRHEGREMPVVYDAERGTIASVLPAASLVLYEPRKDGPA